MSNGIIASPYPRVNNDSAPLLTIEEAARLLTIGRTKVYELVNSGELETVRFGRSCRIVTESVYTLIARKRAEARHGTT